MDWELYREADKRGLLTGEKKQLYDEALARGLVPGGPVPAGAVDPAMRRPDAAPGPGPGQSQGASPPSAGPAPAAPSQPMPPAEAGQDTGVVEDVAKSAGIGLAQGALGLATLPGTIEYLGRAGIDKVGRGLGYDPKLSERTFLPTFGDVKSGVEQYTGPFYKPKTVFGEYARTAGEFAPLAFLGPGGAAARAVNVAAPAIASETAGQVTKGTALEPWARAGGAVLGGSLPNAVMRLRSPAAPRVPDAVRAQHVQTLEANGVTAVTAGQRLGNTKIRAAEDAADHIPFSGERAAALAEQSQAQFTAAALRHAGINADRATGPVINQAFDDLGRNFEQLGARNVLPLDRQLRTGINRAIDEYNYITPASMRPPIFEGLRRDIAQATANQLDGTAYNALRSRIEAARRSSVQNNPQMARALGDIRDELDDAMARSASSADQALWQQSRTQYRNLLAIEKAISGAGEQTALGFISPSQLRSAVKAQNKRTYGRGQNPLAELAKAGEAILKPLKSSGTAERTQAINNYKATGKGVSVLGGLGAVGSGAVSLPAAILGAGAAVTPGALARGFMSGPMQRWLANDRAVPAINAYAQTRLPAFTRAPIAATELTKGPTLSGGIGPDYDEYGNRKTGAFR